VCAYRAAASRCLRLSLAEMDQLVIGSQRYIQVSRRICVTQLPLPTN
jgi:hypothetical protein